MNWKIHYAGAFAFSDLDGPWTDAPGDQVLAVTVRDKGKPQVWTRRILSGRDFYVFVPGDLYPICTNDLTSQLVRMGVDLPDPFPQLDYLRSWLVGAGIRPLVKFSTLVSDDEWASSMRRIHEDPDFAVGTSPNRREDDWSG
jgi:hypothetical protein